MSKSYRFKCRKCHQDYLRHLNQDEFERNQYSINGWPCFSCGYPKMMVMRSKLSANDGFRPGFQRNIGKHCSTYGEYKAHLKRMGLIEIGYEDVDFNESDKDFNYWDEETVKAVIRDHGVDLSGREIDGLIAGELKEMT